MKSRLLASVIIPAYNREDTIGGAVESALVQTYGELEVIVVDDGSTDGTVRALERFGDRIRVICQQNAGPSAARNRGVAASNGEIVGFLDSDDHWLPDKIAKQVALMERAGPGMCCCVCNATVKGVGGAVIGNTFDSAGIHFGFEQGVWTNPQDVLSTRFLLFNQVVAIRREAFDRIGGFNEDLRLLEDYELALRLSAAGPWGVIRDPLVIKFNDTNGIGVECMMNREWHARIRAEVIGGILETETGLGFRARQNLRRALADFQMESRALAMLAREGIPSLAAGHALAFFLRAKRAVRRRSASWPKFRGQAVNV